MSSLLDFPGSDSQSQAGPSAGTGGERTSAIVCAPPEESRLFVALLPPGNARGVDVVIFYDDCASLESDVEQIRPAVIVLSPNSRNYSPALVNRLRRRPDFMVVVVGLVPPAGDFGAEMRAAGAIGTLATPVSEATVDRFVASLPGWIRQAAEERASPAFLFDLTPTAAAAMAAQGYQRGTYISWSPKGGAGKTTLACNLAVLLGVLCQQKTLLVDVNMNGGHVWLHMNVKNDRNIYHLATTFASRGELEPRDLEMEVYPYGQYLDVLPGIPRIQLGGQDELKDQQGAMFAQALFELARRRYDFVIVDMGSSPNNTMHLATMHLADRVLLVITPDRAAIIDARNAIDTLVKSYGFTREQFWLVVNMYTDESGLLRKEIPTWMELVEMGLIPLDPSGRLIRAANTGVPFVLKSLQERTIDADVEAVLEGFVGVATNIYPSLRPVWEDRRERMRRAQRGMPRQAGLFRKLLFGKV